MKILSIEINCLRGIKNLKLNLEGKNAIIVEWPVGSENMLIYKK